MDGPLKKIVFVLYVYLIIHTVSDRRKSRAAIRTGLDLHMYEHGVSILDPYFSLNLYENRGDYFDSYKIHNKL